MSIADRYFSIFPFIELLALILMLPILVLPAVVSLLYVFGGKQKSLYRKFVSWATPTKSAKLRLALSVGLLFGLPVTVFFLFSGLLAKTVNVIVDSDIPTSETVYALFILLTVGILVLLVTLAIFCYFLSFCFEYFLEKTGESPLNFQFVLIALHAVCLPAYASLATGFVTGFLLSSNDVQRYHVRHGATYPYASGDLTPYKKEEIEGVFDISSTLIPYAYSPVRHAKIDSKCNKILSSTSIQSKIELNRTINRTEGKYILHSDVINAADLYIYGIMMSQLSFGIFDSFGCSAINLEPNYNIISSSMVYFVFKILFTSYLLSIIWFFIRQIYRISKIHIPKSKQILQ